MSSPRPHSTLSFELTSHHVQQFGPRVGKVTLRRDGKQSTIVVDTPNIMASTSRGVVPHLSRDHCVAADEVLAWVHLQFESFLDHSPPIPTLVDGPRPFHQFLGFRPEQTILALSLRDPADGREMPPNTNDGVAAQCVRGVRRVTANDWRSHIFATNPDVVVALSDIPWTPPPHSQKRTTKSIDRSLAWLASLLKPVSALGDSPIAGEDIPNRNYTQRLNVLVHMAGGASEAAREAFAGGLKEQLYGPEAAAIAPLTTLDEGVAGYVFDLVPLRAAVQASSFNPSEPGTPISPGTPRKTKTPGPREHLFAEPPPPTPTDALVPLLRASLRPLPATKLRTVHSTGSPHEVLRIIRDAGADLFDAHWAQRAADVGIALDFTFPAPSDVRVGGDAGHNLYEDRFATNFVRLADTFRGAAGEDADSALPVCSCIACSPRELAPPLSHDALSGHAKSPPGKPYTRAYLHHLLHTHEMSAHAFIAAHNLAVLHAFFAGVRAVLSGPDGVAAFEREVARFEEVYDGTMGVIERGRLGWLTVERARGKGWLSREKEKQNQDSLGTAVDL